MKTLGIDWGHREHCAALLEEDGTWSWCVRISARNPGALLARLGAASEVVVVIEAGAPLLPETLSAHGYRVEEVPPSRAGKMRELHFPGGAKDDARDAKSLALIVHHKALGLRGRHVPAPRAAEIRSLCRARARVVQARTVAIQQLIDLVRHAHPGLAALDLNFACGYARALVVAYPCPLAARRARRSKIERLLAEGRARRIDAETVLRSLRHHGFQIPEHRAATCALEAPLLAARITLLTQQIKTVEKALATCYADHPDADQMRSIPGAGPQLAPRISARIDSSFVRIFGAKQAQILAGTAPRTRVSGKRHGGAVMRRAARDRDLHQALFQLARCSLAKSRWARAFVLHHTGGRTRDRKRMNRALRTLANKWVRIIHHLLLTGELYDEQRHIDHLRQNHVQWAPAAEAAA